MDTFDTIYSQLNPEQKAAVDATDGPLLVIAGPGTGKTQLLSARVANILKKTDANPQNILCLTFTEAAAQNMRERLTGMIGSDAYDVHISTYHAFGSEIINTYPEFFESIHQDRDEDIRFETPIDELRQLQMIQSIVESLPYGDPLLNARHYIKDVLNTIADLKKELITPDTLRKRARQNQTEAASASAHVQKIYGSVGTIPRKVDAALQLFRSLQKALNSVQGSLTEQASSELEHALEEAVESQKTKSLTAWKDRWLHKTEDDTWEFTDSLSHKKLEALANVYGRYQKQLQEQHMYDFNDMIVATVHALANKSELRLNLQERYQYILLDEFQDTNAAQFALVHHLADHPVHEGRPNIMAVGDDDQAIYAFQGAELNNMLKFKDAFRDVQVINLTRNYRSHSDIIHSAHNVAAQIETRLHHSIDGVEKTLTAASTSLPDTAIIERHEFVSQANEYQWISNAIKERIDDGVPAQEIAVLAPKHALLMQLVPFLNDKKIPVSYEKRENIFDAPIVQSLLTAAQLITALSHQDNKQANELFPIVLSQDYWGIPTETIWKINWRHTSNWPGTDNYKTWAELALEDESTKDPTLFLLQLSMQSTHMPLEYVLDALLGAESIELSQDQRYTSPLKEYYFNPKRQSTHSLEYYEAISHLSVIRSKLREYQAHEEGLLTLESMLELHTMYRSAQQPLINSHPIAQSDSAVQIMTAYKAKGLEFQAIFLLSLQDNVWGKKAKQRSNSLSLPQNLDYIRYRSGDEDELRRLLFVAMTRAKSHLYMTSHAMTETGKKTEAVKYLLESTAQDGTRASGVLPKHTNTIFESSSEEVSGLRDTEILWHQRHTMPDPELKDLLQERLKNYQMSPTHLNSFTDTIYGGPESFFLGTILRFPHAPGADGEFGNAVHATLEWIEKKVSQGKDYTSDKAIEFFKKDIQTRYIPAEKMEFYQQKGEHALRIYIRARTDMLSTPAESEVNFKREGVLIGDAHLTGKIDRLEVDKVNKTVHIVDYKTGSPHHKWSSNPSLHKYKQQLYFYKLLVEKSHTYADYSVASARIEFVEPHTNREIVAPLYVTFNEEEEQRTQDLINAVWQKIQNLDLPDISSYKQSISGVKAFEEDLLS